MRRLLLLVALVTSLSLVGNDLGRTSGGWTLRLDYSQDVDSLDPALAVLPGSQELLWLTCETLTRYPDAPAPAGSRPVSGGAGPARVSNHGRTYTFTVRRNLRFSDGSPVLADNYAAAIDRVLDPQMNSPAAGLYLSDVVGAQAVMQGKAKTASGVSAHGRVLTIQLQHPAPDILERLALTPFCPIPVSLSHDPAGVDLVPGSGPYMVASRVAEQRIVLVRNRYYIGSRPRGPSRIVVAVGGTDGSNLAAVESGTVDYATDVTGIGGLSLPPLQLHGLVRRYGLNHHQFFVEPTLGVDLLALNSAHGIFARNPSLRRAVNFAVDRRLLDSTFGYLGARRTDRLLAPGVPGYVHAHLYPLGGPDLARARALARAHLRGRKAVLYAPDVPKYHVRAAILASDLARIGIRLETKYFPTGGVYYTKVAATARGYDIAFFGWISNYDDPDFYLPYFLGSDQIGGFNLSRLHDRSVDRALARDTRLPPPARYRAFGRLDVDVMRSIAPYVPYANPAATFLVARRIGCVVYNPVYYLDYGALCLRR